MRTTNKILVLHYENPSGSDELRSALSAFMNRNFTPLKPLTREHITIMNGITSILDAFCFCAAEAGDGVLVAQPFYVGFLDDFRARAG
jgi:1-aminocyclopropane-1-carboxylate synthase